MKVKVTMFGVEIMMADFVQNFCQRLIIIALKNTLRNIQNLNILANVIDEKIFIESEKNELFHQMLELNNL